MSFKAGLEDLIYSAVIPGKEHIFLKQYKKTVSYQTKSYYIGFKPLP